MSLWDFGKCSLALGKRKRKREERERGGIKKEKERRGERRPMVNCIAH